jgi:hypothetical protein
MRTASTNDRDRSLQRLRRSTSVVLAAAGALVVAFAGLAARALPGHHAVKISHVRVQTRRQATPPPLVAAQTQSPPVVVSGRT